MTITNQANLTSKYTIPDQTEKDFLHKYKDVKATHKANHKKIRQFKQN